MSYGVECTDLSFAIRQENIPKVLESLVTSNYFYLHRTQEDCLDIARGGSMDEKTGLLSELLHDNGYLPEFDQNGNVTDLSHQSGYWYDDDKFFEVFAPYVEKGSYIQMAGEDGQLWRMLFDGEHCREIKPVVSWPDCEKIEKGRATANNIAIDVNILAKPLGRSMFITWHELDTAFHKWARAYFGNHVHGGANRDETDCEIALAGLQDSDREKFLKLFESYDKDNDYDATEEFCTGQEVATLPDCVARGILDEILEKTEMNHVGHFTATYDGVFVTEQEMDAGDITVGKGFVSLGCNLPKKPPLEQQIQSAEGKASGVCSMNDEKTKTSDKPR